jgi:hypothetical protein
MEARVPIVMSRNRMRTCSHQRQSSEATIRGDHQRRPSEAITYQPFDFEAGAAAGYKLLQLLGLLTTAERIERLVHLMSKAIRCNHMQSHAITCNLMQSHARRTHSLGAITTQSQLNHNSIATHLPNRHSLGLSQM